MHPFVIRAYPCYVKLLNSFAIMKDRKKILFINPPLSPYQRYGMLSQAGAVEPPLGLTYLAALTRKNGFETEILDSSALGLGFEQTVKIIEHEAPHFVGITLSTISLRASSRLASMVKERMPNTKIIVGGPHFTSLPKQTLLENHSFDIGIIGEGERTLEELLRVLVYRGSLPSVNGIAFRSNGKIILNSKRPRITNLDELPLPAFDLLPELKRYYRTTTQSIKYLPTTSLVTSRGCIGHCLFCDRKTFGNEIHMHSAEYVADLMQKLQKDFGIKGIIFEEDNFMLSEERLVNLAKLIKKRKVRIHWSALSRIDTITEEKLKIAKGCGCWQILYGIESGSQKILDFYKKDITLEQIKRTVYLTKNCGLYVKGLFILGNPLESLETLQETRDLIKSLPLDDISLTYFTPYPGADIWGKVKEFGQFDKDWDKLTCFDLVFIPQGISEKNIITTQKVILKEFYSSIRVLWSYLIRLRSLSQVKELYKSWRGLLSYSESQNGKKRLIINADDFGLCEGINRGIEKLLHAGIVKSVSIMPTGYAFESAISIVRHNPNIDIGVHLSLIGTKPNQSEDRISSLANKTGKFEDKFLPFFMRYLFGGIKKNRIIGELRAQIEQVKKNGLEITHLDSHQHMHMLPGIFKIILKLAKEYKIPFIRLPVAPVDFFDKMPLRRKVFQLVLNVIGAYYKGALKKEGIYFCKHSFGFMESGHLNQTKIKDILMSLKKDRFELVCHPAEEDEDLSQLIGHWGYRWKQELEALNSDAIKECIYCQGIELTGFQN